MATTVPGYLRDVVEFLNTEFGHLPSGHHHDLVATPALLGAWLREAGLLKDGADPTPEEHALALGVRDALRDLAEVNTGDREPGTCVDRLNDAATAASLVVHFDREGRAHLHPDAKGVPGALGWIMAGVFRSMASGEWERLKVCKSGTCSEAFYDRSKNRSGTWCSMKTCGNREKVRQYRKRVSDS